MLHTYKSSYDWSIEKTREQVFINSLHKSLSYPQTNPKHFCYFSGLIEIKCLLEDCEYFNFLLLRLFNSTNIVAKSSDVIIAKAVRKRINDTRH